MKSKSPTAKPSITANSIEAKTKRLETLCKGWQAGLRLQDWKVQVRYAHASEFERQAIGQCRCNMNNKTAEILILPNDGSEPMAEEMVLIHELLHLHLNNLDVPGERGTEEEQVINCVAEALHTLMCAVRTATKKK